MLLNILKHTRQLSATKKYLALRSNSAEVEESCYWGFFFSSRCTLQSWPGQELKTCPFSLLPGILNIDQNDT